MRNIFDLYYTEDGEASFTGMVFLRDSVPVPEGHPYGTVRGRRRMMVWNVLEAVLVLGGIVFLHDWLMEDTPLGVGLLMLAAAVGLHLLRLCYSRKQSAAEASRPRPPMPPEAKQVDLLRKIYWQKTGKRPLDTDPFDYVNLCGYAWLEDDCLLLTGAFHQVAVPLSAITAVRRLDVSALDRYAADTPDESEAMSALRDLTTTPVSISPWNKAEAVDGERYKPYTLNKSFGSVEIRAVYVLEITRGGEEYQLLVPEYDWDLVLEPLIGGYVPAPLMERSGNME